MKSIDERIVDMQFNNKQFEDGIQTSLKSLDNLRRGLDDTGKGNALSALQAGVETISDKFSALGIMGVTALQNITNAAINTGTALIKSLTTDPIKSGLQEYETKMGSITTILTNTESKGTTLDDVNKALAELNEYADLTIYNFAEMTRNIGTFTAAGVELDTSVTAIKGIANLAAGSGSTSQQASTAMYQLSQALSSGTVRLQDWNSVVNAGMGGELFKNKLLDIAKTMGVINTEFEDGQEKVVSYTSKGEKELKTFRDSLSDGWLSKDVLITALTDFANDDSLIKAATEVKTITQLVDTMQESVQSGWAVSWEHVIGDKEQATKTLTAVSDAFNALIEPATEARNSMLKFWNENGGRDAIIQAVVNSFKGLQQIITPVSDAFREIFPPMTGEKLVAFSEGLMTLTEKFKIGEETADKLKRTFKGVFAFIDMLGQGFIFLAQIFGEIVGHLMPVDDGFLTLTASLGAFLVTLREGGAVGDIFTESLGSIRIFIDDLAEGIRTTIVKIGDYFGQFSGIDIGPLRIFSGELEAQFRPFSFMAETARNAMFGIKEVFDWIAPYFQRIGEGLSDSFGKIKDVVGNGMERMGFDSFLDFVNTLLAGGVLIGIKQFVDSLSDIAEGANGFLEGVTGILDGVRGSLEAYQAQLKSKTLMNIALAIGILAAALLVLSTIPAENMTVALAGITALFVELAGIMLVLSNHMGAIKMGTISIQMMALATAILILSVAMKNIAEPNYEELSKGLIGVGVLIAELVAFMRLMGDGKGLIQVGIAMIPLATGILILSQAVKSMGQLSWEELSKGLIGLAGSLLIIVGASKLVSPGSLLAMGVALVGVGVGINLIALALHSMGDLSIGELAKGLIAMAGGLLIIVGASKLVSPSNLLAMGVALTGVGVALNLMALAMKAFGSMSWEQIGKSLIVLAGSLTILAVAMKVMQGGIAGAAALTLMATALALLVPSLVVLGSMDLENIGMMLLALVGVFAIFGVAGLALGPLVPVLLGVSGAIALLGVGVLSLGAGLTMLATAMVAISAGSVASMSALTLVATTIIGLIPLLLVTLAEGILQFIQVLADGVPIIMAGVTAIVLGIIQILVDLAPNLVEALYVFLEHIMQTLLDHVPNLIDAGMTLLASILDGIADGIPGVIAAAVAIIIAFIEAIGEETPKIIDAGAKMIIDFINGLADTIRNNAPLLVEAYANLASAMIEGLIGGIFAGTKGCIDAIVNLGEAICNGFKKLLGIHSPSTVFNDMAGNIISGLVNGLGNGIGAVGKASKEIAVSVINEAKKKFEDIKDVAAGVIDGLSSGLRAGASKVAEAAKGVASKALDSAKSFLGINSPSKAFAEVGKYSGEGMVVGLKGMATKIGAVSENVGNTALSAMRDSLSKVSDAFSGDMDMIPTIRPVIDMSNVEKGLNSTFAKEQHLNVSGIKEKASYVSTANSQNGTSSAGDNSYENTDNSQIQIVNQYHVRNDNDIQKINRGLDNIISKYSRTKGVPVKA